ncbi:CENPB DNA-binding domain-containing protein 1-like [Octopus sinensis]|uniref:CENPB DNA-binding domain-containing protein 1-like n=1 Tax=Octopus sinensis TaxID=2607531 RepID=A0A6P7SY14_9MOLL|nr:CENPB DNA-binding domain-containing protein 1-like [Octopus sinensis]
MNCTTVSAIVHNRDRIMAHVKDDAPGMKSTIINKKRGRIYEEMEQLLALWDERQNHQQASCSQEIIQEKALSLFEDLKDIEFKASQRWFMIFKQQQNLHSLKKQGESTSGDDVAAVEFPATLAKIIENNATQTNIQCC